jgi:plasmid maintenance system killer protein
LEVSFDDPDLAEMCASEKVLLRKCGTVRARKIQQRIKDLRAAETLEDMRKLPGRCHELHGNWAGHLSLDLDHPYRLLFRPVDAPEPEPGSGGGLDWKQVRRVAIVEIVDTHE